MTESVKPLWRRLLWPDSLLAQMVILVVAALLVAQIVGYWLLSSAFRQTISYQSERHQIRQFSTLVAVLEQAPAQLDQQILRSWKRPGREYRLQESPPIAAPETLAERRIAGLLESWLGSEYDGQTRVKFKLVQLQHPPPHWHPDRPPPKGEYHQFGAPSHQEREDWRRWREKRRPKVKDLELAAQLSDGRWLYGRSLSPQLSPFAARYTTLMLVVALVLVVLVVYWQMRRIVRPLRELRHGAEDLGRGKAIKPLPETGPGDVRKAVTAFNLMSDRLQRFVDERMRLLAALSHDLRTPITTMRLRVELMADSDEKQKLLASLDEMQAMSEATLDFVRGSGDKEPSSSINVTALVTSLCDDLREIGLGVAVTDGPDQLLECRPLSLTRALRNVIQNAVDYGGEAQVSLTGDDLQALIEVRDQGPGIPPQEMERVFEPFYRLESSRSRETGGIGLGLAIARQIISAHGGSIRLQNTNPGLKVTIELPKK